MSALELIKTILDILWAAVTSFVPSASSTLLDFKDTVENIINSFPNCILYTAIAMSLISISVKIIKKVLINTK